MMWAYSRSWHEKCTMDPSGYLAKALNKKGQHELVIIKDTPSNKSYIRNDAISYLKNRISYLWFENRFLHTSQTVFSETWKNSDSQPRFCAETYCNKMTLHNVRLRTKIQRSAFSFLCLYIRYTIIRNILPVKILTERGLFELVIFAFQRNGFEHWFLESFEYHEQECHREDISKPVGFQ